VGAGIDAGVDDATPCPTPPVTVPHISQNLLPGDSIAPQLEQSNGLAGAGVGTAGLNAVPQRSQKAQSGIADAPQAGQVVAVAMEAGCLQAADGEADSPSFAPHLSQNTVLWGCCEPHLGHMGIAILLAGQLLAKLAPR
jgi:hypothetical protein